MTGKPRLTYQDAGVDIEAAESALADASADIRSTFTPGVLGDIGLFGGLFHLGAAGFKDPILVSSADGVGTKLEVAKRVGVHDTVGRDLVQHCINDILVQGARPLFFFDYAAMGKLEPAVIRDLVRGCAAACRANGLALLGGETAEMPGLYRDGDFELVGFIVGAVERELLIDGTGVRPGQVLLGLPSAGLHTNGFSLARHILFERLGLGVEDRPDALGGRSIGEALLAEHRSYLELLMPLVEAKRIPAMAHITGGGLPGNLARLLRDTNAVVDVHAWPTPPLFEMLVEGGDLESAEAHRAFNMGIGMVLFIEPEDAAQVQADLEARGEPVFRLGKVTEGSGLVELEGLMLAWFLTVLLGLSGLAEEPDWGAIWTQLRAIEAGDQETPGNVERADRLVAVAAGTEDRTRAALLLARIARWRQQPAEAHLAQLAAGDLEQLTAQESWLAVDALPPGPARVKAALHGIEQRSELTRDELLLAWRAGYEETLGLSFRGGALPLQRTLHELNRATWSALDLSITLSRLGEREEMDLVLEEAIEAEQAAGRPTGALWSQWGVSTLGFGDTALARDYLGRALSQGSTDAGLVLGLLDLEAGRHASARNAFRRSILSEQPSAWALRGWGLSLLPEPRIKPATLPSPSADS